MVPRVPHRDWPQPPYSQILVKCKVGKYVESHVNFQLLLSLSHTHKLSSVTELYSNLGYKIICLGRSNDLTQPTHHANDPFHALSP
jgi:hypothetical protein